MYYKPHFTDDDHPFNWIGRFIEPITKSICPLQGFKCPSNKPCDCEKYCSNGKEFNLFQVVEETDRIYVMNQKLSPGTYCLPKGIGQCNLKTSYHVFSLAGWSCLGLNDDVFKGDKKTACKNEEAQNNDLNILYDYLENKEVGDNIDDYYEPLQNKLRYGCKCGSKSLDNTRMISVFPFICSVDFCLRDIPQPRSFMGWNGKECECGPYFHLDPNDTASPCRKETTRVEKDEFIGRVDCMNEKSFVKQALICPTDDGQVIFKEKLFLGNDPVAFVSSLIS